MVEGRIQVVEQVQQAGIEMADLSGGNVAEKAVDRSQCFRYVMIAPAVNEVDSLVGVGVIKTKAVLAWGALQCMSQRRGKQQHA